MGAHGLKGLLKVDPLTDFLSRFEAGSRLRLRGQWVEVESMTMHKGRPLLRLPGVDSIDAAEKLQWEYLEAAGRPELDEDEFLASDLVGLRVVTEEGEELGVVDDVLPYPAQDVLQVGEILIPVVKEFVRDIDVDAGVVTVRLIYGMRPGQEG